MGLESKRTAEHKHLWVKRGESYLCLRCELVVHKVEDTFLDKNIKSGKEHE